MPGSPADPRAREQPLPPPRAPDRRPPTRRRAGMAAAPPPIAAACRELADDVSELEWIARDQARRAESAAPGGIFVEGVRRDALDDARVLASIAAGLRGSPGRCALRDASAQRTA